LPKTGLIIDLRGNSGGYIAAGERILQLFTPNQITPSRFQFRVTPAVQSMVKQWDEFKTWTPSVGQANLTGEPYSQGYSIEGTDVDANQLGQHYFGPVVLIGDALAFSTADIFTAGFIDHEIGKVICTDENMAAAGGNNWYPWDVIRLYNPDFHLDPALKPTFEAGLLSQEVRDAFNYCGATLSEHAVLSAGQPEYDGIAWSITDGAITHVVRSLPLDTKLLCVYLAKGNFGLADMPSGITVSLTMRRCIRVKKSEGQILEDLGIHPDIVYHLTFRDVMEQNQDLNIRASLELSKMPVYDLQVNVAPKGDMYALMCRTLHLNSIEVFAGQHFLTGAPASDDTSVELSIPAMVGKIEVCGLVADAIVARSVIIAPPLGLTIHQITESNAR
jgi:hypothetical protein